MEYLIEQASSFAGDIDRLILIVAVLGGFWFFLAEGVLIYFMVRYRRKKEPKASYITGEEHKYKKWIHWAHYGVILCDIVIIVFAIKYWYDIKQDLPPAEETIRVVGYQWAWKFVHPGADGELGSPEDVETMDELHIKVGKTYHFKLEAGDVLHDFSVPVFRLKHDAVPGRISTGWFKATKTGVFDIQCAKMCGIGHGIMVAKLYIQTEEDYDKWILARRPKVETVSID